GPVAALEERGAIDPDRAASPPANVWRCEQFLSLKIARGREGQRVQFRTWDLERADQACAMLHRRLHSPAVRLLRIELAGPENDLHDRPDREISRLDERSQRLDQLGIRRTGLADEEPVELLCQVSRGLGAIEHDPDDVGRSPAAGLAQESLRF